MTETPPTRRIFICGSALRGQPDHQNLGAAKFIRSGHTQPLYRLHAAGEGWHPAIYQTATGGVSIPGEVYELTQTDFDYLAANEPPHMYPSDVVMAFLYPQALIEQYNWPDISDLGGWAAYKAGQ
jgi:gamma-glutamylaminecyclotransferase